MQTNTAPQTENIYTVSRLNSEVRSILEHNFPFVWVEGEISNFSAPNSGHWYFSLKDPAAQVRCAMFRGSQRKLQFVPKDGMHVLLKARVSLYENRGDFQLIAEDIEERGEGKLRRAYDALKKKLEAAGLFNEEHKKPIPIFPKRIGVITSATGAAIRDILTVLKRRFSCANVVIYPSLVQGDGAAKTLVEAIENANKRKECDVLILARGGGSLEDLWPFNEEILAHAIYKSSLAIISGVGHEVDFTIADFVADKRAATPTAAAELVTPHQKDLLKILSTNQKQIIKSMKNRLSVATQQIVWIKKHLVQQHPKRRLLEKMQRLDFYELTLVQLQTRIIHLHQYNLKNLDLRIHRQSPKARINTLINQIHTQEHVLRNLLFNQMERYKALLAKAAAKLDTLSPLATLKRGYAIVTTKETMKETTKETTKESNKVICSAKQVKPGDSIDIRLAQGIIGCVVEEVISN